MKHLLLYKYPVKTKSGRIKSYFKQLFCVNYDDSIKVGGNSDPGFTLSFYPEGTMSNTVISEKDLFDIIKYQKSDFYGNEIFLIELR